MIANSLATRYGSDKLCLAPWAIQPFAPYDCRLHLEHLA